MTVFVLGARALVAALVIGGALGAAATAAEPRLISIGTGGKGGVYYPAGGAICSLVNRNRSRHGVRCVAENTGGSVDNLRGVRDGSLTFGIAQSDWQYHAVRGTSVFESDGPDRTLRALFSLYQEPFTVVARPGAGVTHFRDLKGKKVNVGQPGSGGRATMDFVMDAMGWTAADFAAALERETNELPRALCSGEIDAAVFIIGHPNLVVRDMVTSCDAGLVAIDGPEIDRLVAETPYFFRAVIPVGTYPGQAISTPVFALGATVVTSSRTAADVVYEVVKGVFENLGELRETHPALAGLERVRMMSDGLTAPLHAGAIRYYREAGLR